MDLEQLVPFLRKHAVKRFKDGGVEIEFEPTPEAPPLPSPEPKIPAGVPAEIANPDLMTQKQIEEWSAPGAIDPNEPVVAGTGDAPIQPPHLGEP